MNVPTIGSARHVEMVWRALSGCEGIRPGRCLIAHTLKSTHIATALHPVMKATTVSQLVDEVSRFTDAEQWLIVAFVTLMVVVFTCWVGFAVVLVTRTVLSIGRRAAAKIPRSALPRRWPAPYDTTHRAVSVRL